jgi:CheY-like chemotaxis protein/predicted DNA-binding transcriptional regulator AlpA
MMSKNDSAASEIPYYPNGAQLAVVPSRIESRNGSRRILHSWKEIAAYLGRGVRTIQRYETQLGFPIRRPARKDRSAVMAFTDEIDQWLNRAPVKDGHMRRVLLVLDLPMPGIIPNRKLVLEVGGVDVLAASTAEELFEKAEKFDVDAYVLQCASDDALATEMCESLKERHPQKPIVTVALGTASGDRASKRVNAGNDLQKLLAAVKNAFGQPPVV